MLLLSVMLFMINASLILKCAEIFETLQEINYILSTEDSILRHIKYGEKYNLFIFIFMYVFEILMSSSYRNKIRKF